MIDDLTVIVSAYVAEVYKTARAVKPDTTDLEVDGLSLRLLVSALDNYKKNEQLQKISTQQGQSGTQGESQQVQRVGSDRRLTQSKQGLRAKQRRARKSREKLTRNAPLPVNWVF